MKLVIIKWSFLCKTSRKNHSAATPSHFTEPLHSLFKEINASHKQYLNNAPLITSKLKHLWLVFYTMNKVFYEEELRIK